MAKVKLVLDKRANVRKVDGTYPLVLSISHKTKTRIISLKYSFELKNWDATNNSVVGLEKAKFITAKLKSQLSIAELYLLNNQMEVDEMDATVLKTKLHAEIFSDKLTNPASKKKYIAKRTNKSSLTDRVVQVVNDMRRAGDHGNADAVQGGLDAFKRFSNDEILFADVDLTFLKEFVIYCKGRQNSGSTISAYMRPIKKIIEDAVREEIIGVELNAFLKFKMPKIEKTKHRALRIAAIQKIREHEVKPKTAHWNAKNYFLFMFNNMGMNFIDMAKLEKHQIHDQKFEGQKLIAGRLLYKRSKNGRNYSIKLTAESLEIINHYDFYQKEKKDKVFPIGFVNTKTGRATYKQKRKRVNGRLKDIAKKLGLDEEVTTYYARHSWATIAKRKMLPISVIAEGLGHSDVKTTEIYLDSFDSDVLDDANEGIVS